MSNKAVRFKNVYVITVKGNSRKHPEDELAFLESWFEKAIVSFVDFHDRPFKGLSVSLEIKREKTKKMLNENLSKSNCLNGKAKHLRLRLES